jgi:hypothetical protein
MIQSILRRYGVARHLSRKHRNTDFVLRGPEPASAWSIDQVVTDFLAVN